MPVLASDLAETLGIHHNNFSQRVVRFRKEFEKELKESKKIATLNSKTLDSLKKELNNEKSKKD